ncbi:MAG: GIY-YIG nuclease family protein [Verrucomicrobia bacterium]|jgi:putative endonuclease|nr:GIY-YIG nuclease family protein [Verrucomicrobiota bacterium]
MFYVYVLQSEKDQGLYIGYTTDLKGRLSQHQAGEARATVARYPFELIYYEAYLMEEDATGRERFLKSGSGRKYLDKQLKHHFAAYPRRETA